MCGKNHITDHKLTETKIKIPIFFQSSLNNGDGKINVL